MADPRDPTQNPLPQRVVPKSVTRPIDPEELYDLTIGPGDSAVQAAYARTSRGTQFLGGNRNTASVGDANDALMIQKRAKWSRTLTFTVQGIMWRAGFAPDMAQTPLGQNTPFRTMGPEETVSPAGAILRPCKAEFELVFRELIPRALLEQCDHMYGMVRKLEHVAFYYFPAGSGATAGILATYADLPSSRGHVLYLQTNIKNASPTVLEQIQKTFGEAVPRAVEAAKEVKAGDFWQELDKSVYQVRATLKNSKLAGGTQAATKTMQRGLQQAGQGVDQAISIFDLIGQAFSELGQVPGRIGVGIVRGFSGFLIRIIKGLDRIGGDAPGRQE
jgi:hypothetical protein